MKIIAIIPARSGSKGLRNKNIRELNKKPLLYYSIKAAQDAGIFDTIHVSTDSEEYAEIAREYGADVPFLRDDKWASDIASTWDAVRYVLEEYVKLGKEYDAVVVLQPTSPLRDGCDVVGAWEYFVKKDANMVSSVCEMEHSPLWCNTLPDSMSMADFEDEAVAYIPRQSLPIYYRENGAIYIVKTSSLYKTDNLYKDRCYAYIMDQSHSIDIDTEVDFIIAQALMTK